MIRVNLDVMMAKRHVSLGELAARVPLDTLVDNSFAQAAMQ